MVRRPLIDRVRDTVAVAIANWTVNHVATKWYRDRVNALITIGMDTAARIHHQEFPAPDVDDTQ